MLHYNINRWCKPCKAIYPYFKEMANKHNEIKYIKVDIDEYDELALNAGASLLPTFQIYKNGIKTYTVNGAKIDIVNGLFQEI